MSATADRPPRRSSRLWLFGMACGAVATLETPTAVLAGLLLAPSLLAWPFDTSEDKSLARPILFCGLAAALRPLLALWQGKNDLAGSLTLASDLSVLGLAWAAQASAWLVCELAPLAVGLAQAARDRARIARLKAERARLAEEWGLSATEVAPPEE
jgi:hypothetical protein